MTHYSWGQDSVPADLEEVNVYESLKKTGDAPGSDVKMSTLEEQDDLESLKDDVGEIALEKEKVKPATPELAPETKTEAPKEVTATAPDATVIDGPKEGEAPAKTEFDLAEDEKKILSDLAKGERKKILNKDWSDMLAGSKITQYKTQKGEDLKSISKKLFGIEDYYSKIWAQNPQISNPYDIEAGTILTFDTGDSDTMPNVQLGEFKDDDDDDIVPSAGIGARTGGASFNEKNRPGWIKERRKLIDQGVYFQFASEETYEDLARLEKAQQNVEYEKYDPPMSDVYIKEPGEQYDSNGFDKTSKIVFNYKEGFFLNSFVTTNVVQDLGEIKAAQKESVFIHKGDILYVTFDKSAKVKPGDLFSVYTAGGEVKNVISDRSGFVYTTTAQIKALQKKDDVWECLIIDQSGMVQRKDRITVYTPKIGKISRTFSKRSVEAAIIGSYRDSLTGIAFGDVVYLDRGRADGVELGNLFEIYSFVDRGTQRKITPSPTYKVGELTVINITDNFATALVTNSSNEITLGSIAITKTQEEAARVLRLKSKDKLKDVRKLEGKALDELDVELNLDDVSQDILNKADKIQLTEDELEELERQERDKSVIKDSERDVKELDRLEGEIQESEKSLNESKVDEDKFLEQSSLEEHEKKAKLPDPNAFESINEIEKDIGRKYLDEDINNKENPYGLTEFDLEEVDELLNTGPKK
ncbi:MAG: hypothetical protein WC635_03640 [Bacteriovorax sp.]|jgi:hypothetical protein